MVTTAMLRSTWMAVLIEIPEAKSLENVSCDLSANLKPRTIKKAKSAIKKVNPERQQNLIAAKAEETLIASLLHNPDFYAKIKDNVSDDDFATELNRRIYKVIASHIEESRPVEITYFASELSDEEIGYLVRLESMRENLGNTVKECLDCIRRMREEKQEREIKNPAGMTDDEWFSQIKKRKDETG